MRKEKLILKKVIVVFVILNSLLILNACQISRVDSIDEKVTRESESTVEHNDDTVDSTIANKELSNNANLDAKKWREDLEQLKHDITWYNSSPFERYGEEKFNTLYNELYEQIPNLSDNEIEYKIRELVYSIGDGHIDIWQDEEGDYSLPIMIDELYDGFYVVNALDSYGDWIGTKVESINGEKIEVLVEKLEKISNSENQYWQRAGAIDKLHHKYFYKLLGLQLENDAILINDEELEFIDVNNDEFYSWYRELDVSYMPNATVGQFYTYFFPYEYGFVGGSHAIEDGEVLYFRFSTCYYEDEEYPLIDFAEDLLNDALENKSKLLIVDLRNNGGGNSSQIYSVLTDRFFEQTPFVKNGNIFVLTNSQTFSAGAITAHVLKDKFGATIIGTPTGGSPFTTGVTDTANKVLKNTGINFRVSSAKVSKKMIENPSEIPDLEVKGTSEDVKNNVDPVFEYIIRKIEQNIIKI